MTAVVMASVTIVTVVAARVAIPAIVLTPLLIAPIPPLVVRGVAALALRAKFHPRVIRLAAVVAMLAHFFREPAFGFLRALLALFHAFAVSFLALAVLIVLPMRNLRNRNAGKQHKQAQR